MTGRSLTWILNQTDNKLSKKVGSLACSNRQYNALLIESGFDNKGHIFGANHLNLVWKTPIFRPCVHQPSPRDTNVRVSWSILSKPIIVRIRLKALGSFWPTVFVPPPNYAASLIHKKLYNRLPNFIINQKCVVHWCQRAILILIKKFNLCSPCGMN